MALKNILTFILASFSFGATFVQALEKPNILWLTCEDNNVSWIGCYGNPHASTPNIDRLAKEGFQYMHCYANAPVCAPSRSSWITGMHSSTLGTQPMRSRYDIPHDQIKYYPDHLQNNGYWTANSTKTDYNIGGREDKSVWNRSKRHQWSELKKKQPFFQVINSTLSHESKAFGSVYNTKHDPSNTKLAAYHPDIPVIRKNYAHYHDQIEKMDTEIGEYLAQLKALGLEDNTIVIYNSDHGGVLPRSKRFLYQSGIHCPLIIRIPEQYKHLWPAEQPGTQIQRLVSFVDMTKTWLDITGSEVPQYLQGQTFLGENTEPERTYHVSYRGRMDERVDQVRAVCDKKYLYVRNYMPHTPGGQHLSYLWRMEATRAWQAHHDAGETNDVTGRWFREREHEELYDVSQDPYNVNNLADDPEFADIKARLKSNLREWQINTRDTGLLPEKERVRLAEENNTTIYQFAKSDTNFPIESLIDSADLAMAKDKANASVLIDLTKHQHLGHRYWGTLGLLLLEDEAYTPNLEGLLSDDSHVVRVTAAHALLRLGKTEQAVRTLHDLVATSSYASVDALNVIDLTDQVESIKDLLPIIENSPDNYVTRFFTTFTKENTNAAAVPPKGKK